PEATDALKLNTQLWVSHYNPFNISLRATASQKGGGLRVHHVPQITYAVPDSIELAHVFSSKPRGYYSMRGLSKGEYHVPFEVLVGPGRGQMCAFATHVEKDLEHDAESYSTQVQNLTDIRVFKNHQVLNGPLSGGFDWFVDISDSTLGHGVNNNDNRNYELSQIIFNPIALGQVNGGFAGLSSGLRLNFEDATLNTNSMGIFIMKLRSTNQSGDSIRPLVDSNIRGIYFNPRWDSPLNLDMVAPYTWLSNADPDNRYPENTDDLLSQIPEMATTEDGSGFSYWGAGHDSFAGYDRVILFDVPRSDLVSLGQLQHANIGRFSYEPSYIAGNSYANPRIPLDNWKASVTDTFSTLERGLNRSRIIEPFDLYDASYLVNEALWDSYTFTTIPQVADNYDDPDEPSPDEEHFAKLLSGEELLPNPRYIPYEPSGSSFNIETLQSVGDDDNQSSFYHNAGHLLVDGAFNVNSTSVDAWEAFLSGTYGMPYQKLDENGQVEGYEMPDDKMVRYPRVQSVFGGPMKSSSPDENFWVGFRALEQEEVRELAEEIVNQIIERGPFLTLADFVNRKLEDSELGEKGALQAALDETVNNNITSELAASATHPALPSGSNQAAGFPGQLLQGDILQALAPFMTVRSDTFTIRAYGESLSPGNGKTLAKVWCEATVQRYPDPASLDPNTPYLEELAQPSSPLGRKFRIISFRWLNENEI
ncbi:MAG TPA: hypothetical protein VJ952_13015, partial [Opitutales bacterium]|nr:hypothetical protein [Opitutales bacterium]